MLGVLLLIAIATVFFVVLFLHDKRKLIVALVYIGIIGVSLLVLFTNIGVLPYILTLLAMVIIIAVMLLFKGQAVSLICWMISILLIGVAAFIGLGSYEVQEVFRVSLPDAFNSILRLLSISIPSLAFIGFMIAASIIRKKRWKAFSIENETSGDSTMTQDGYYSRVQHSGCAKAGNIFSLISYIIMLSGIRILYGDKVDINPLEFLYREGNSPIGFFIASIVISLICGFVAWLLLRYAMGYGYKSGELGKTAYIWSWIPAIIIIALIVLAVVLMCAFTEAEFSTVANKKVYKVKDENGEVRTLDYNGDGTYAKCKDDKGEWWETFDGGSTFSKCDLYKIKDDDGNDKYIHDVSGGGKRIFTDGQGGTYESDDGGMTVTEQK